MRQEEIYWGLGILGAIFLFVGYIHCNIHKEKIDRYFENLVKVEDSRPIEVSQLVEKTQDLK